MAPASRLTPLCLVDLCGEPALEAGDRRQAGELAQLRVLSRQLPYDPLDQVVTQLYPLGNRLQRLVVGTHT